VEDRGTENVERPEPTPGRVLIVDDCRITLLLVKHILAKLGVAVDTAGSAKEGLHRALEGTHALYFLDIMLPDTDGYELCRQIRARKPEAFLPEKAREAGADDVLFKPVVPSRILDLARASCIEHRFASDLVPA
jgi:CheY-like chemotaxis protein